MVRAMHTARTVAMRTFTLILPLGLATMLLGCGLLNGGDEPPESKQVTPTVAPTAVSDGQQFLGTAPLIYLGPNSLEERILASPVIARVRLDSATSTVESSYHLRRHDEVHGALGVQLQRSGVS